jgi:16S rRNA (cytidine1402-2'-O)-methyltransferase
MAVGGPSLYLVATPIGNLEDITLRALRVLKEVDLIACEDTRQTLKLLSHYGIQTRLVSYHEHNEMTKAAELVVDLEGGAKIALVTDAGMPGISDPGFRLIALAIRHHVPVVPDSRSVGVSGGAGSQRPAHRFFSLQRLSPVEGRTAPQIAGERERLSAHAGFLRSPAPAAGDAGRCFRGSRRKPATWLSPAR